MEGTADGWSCIMLDTMADMCNQSMLTDIKLMTKDGATLNAHSLVLAAASDHFKTAFYKVRSAGNTASIIIKLAYNSITVQNIINFIYTGKVSVIETDIDELVRAAKTLQIPTLQMLCKSYKESQEQQQVSQALSIQDIVTKQEAVNSVANDQKIEVNAEPTDSSAEEDLPNDLVEDNEEMEESESGNAADTSNSQPQEITEVSSNVELDGNIVETDASNIMNNLVSIEEVGKTVSIESLLVNSTPIDIPDLFSKMRTVTEVDQSKVKRRRNGWLGPMQVYRYQCDICGKDFSSLYRLKGHHATHFGEKAYQCGQCGKKYVQIEYLREHESIHRPDKPYKCDKCNKKFRILRHLKKHQTVHNDYRPFACSICDKTFKRSDRLRGHMRTHTGERPYDCHICGKNFKLKETLIKHMDTHTVNRPYKCPICMGVFKRKDVLLTHLDTHRKQKRFHCGLPGCSYSFSQLTHLKKHLQVYHSGSQSKMAVIKKPRIGTSEVDELLYEAQNKQKVSEPNSGNSEMEQITTEQTSFEQTELNESTDSTAVEVPEVVTNVKNSNEIGLLLKGSL